MGNNIEKGKRFVSCCNFAAESGWYSGLVECTAGISYADGGGFIARTGSLGFFIPVFNSDPDIPCACQLFDDYLAPPE